MSARPLRFLGIAVLLMSAPIARAEVTRELHGQLAGAAGREFAVENLLGTMQVVAGPGPGCHLRFAYAVIRRVTARDGWKASS